MLALTTYSKRAPSYNAFSETMIAPSTWETFQERVARLYEQNAPQEEILRRIEQYVRSWKRRVRTG